jgi:PIN domain
VTTDTVLLDTCVLVPIRLTSVLMYAATRGVFTPRWSPRILASVERVVTDIHEDVTPQQIAHRVKQMTLEFPGAMVTGHEYLIPAMDNHEGDRHVLAAAVHVGVDILVTDNVKHFPDDVMQRHNIVVQTADEFLLGLYEAYPDRMADSVIAAVTARRRPPESVTDFLDDLAKCGVPRFAETSFPPSRTTTGSTYPRGALRPWFGRNGRGNDGLSGGPVGFAGRIRWRRAAPVPVICGTTGGSRCGCTPPTPARTATGSTGAGLSRGTRSLGCTSCGATPVGTPGSPCAAGR